MWGKVSCLRKQHDGGDWASHYRPSDLKYNAIITTSPPHPQGMDNVHCLETAYTLRRSFNSLDVYSAASFVNVLRELTFLTFFALYRNKTKSLERTNHLFCHPLSPFILKLKYPLCQILDSSPIFNILFPFATASLAVSSLEPFTRILWQTWQTFSSFPFLYSSAALKLEQCPHTTLPQARQWCLRRNFVNMTSQSMHMLTASSRTQAGAFLPRSPSFMTSILLALL